MENTLIYDRELAEKTAHLGEDVAACDSPILCLTILIRNLPKSDRVSWGYTKTLPKQPSKTSAMSRKQQNVQGGLGWNSFIHNPLCPFAGVFILNHFHTCSKILYNIPLNSQFHSSSLLDSALFIQLLLSLQQYDLSFNPIIFSHKVSENP